MFLFCWFRYCFVCTLLIHIIHDFPLQYLLASSLPLLWFSLASLYRLYRRIVAYMCPLSFSPLNAFQPGLSSTRSLFVCMVSVVVILSPHICPAASHWQAVYYALLFCTSPLRLTSLPVQVFLPVRFGSLRVKFIGRHSCHHIFSKFWHTSGCFSTYSPRLYVMVLSVSTLSLVLDSSRDSLNIRQVILCIPSLGPTVPQLLLSIAVLSISFFPCSVYYFSGLRVFACPSALHSCCHYRLQQRSSIGYCLVSLNNGSCRMSLLPSFPNLLPPWWLILRPHVHFSCRRTLQYLHSNFDKPLLRLF